MDHPLKQLEELWARERIELQRGDIFASTPPAVRRDGLRDRVDGMMLGLAIGDALGMTTEAQRPARRRAAHGEVRDYIATGPASQAVGLPSDDSQMAFWTLEQINDDGGFEPQRLARIFSTREIVGMGHTVATFRHNTIAGQPWWAAGPASAGNGALMRIAPILIPHLANPGPALWAETAMCAAMTHNDSGSTAACLAWVAMLWELLAMDHPPEPAWWARRYGELATPLETGKLYRPRGGSIEGDEGLLVELVSSRLRWAEAEAETTLEACEAFHSGAYLLETLSCVLVILTRFGHDPEEAIVRAVNDTKDNDTAAAIVGSAVGALHGRTSLPPRWIEGLLGRTRQDDDGRVFALLDQAASLWLGPD